MFNKTPLHLGLLCKTREGMMTRIKRISVEGAKFFGDPLEIEFSNKLNCLMGGRGTGKTTLLSLITASLENNVEQNKDTFSLLSSNLGQGKIRLTIENIDGEIFEVEKVLGDNPIVYTADRSLIDFDSFREHVIVDFYGATKIEEIGTNPLNRLSLIDKHLIKKINSYRKQETLIFSQLNQNKAKISDLLIKKRELLRQLEPLEDVERDFREYKKIKPEGSDEQTKEFNLENEKQIYREFEMQFRESTDVCLKSVQFKLDQVFTEVMSYISQIGEFETKLNTKQISAYKASIVPFLENIKQGLEKSRKDVNTALENSADKASELEQSHRKQETIFTQLKQKFEKNREYFQRLNQLTKRVTAKTVCKKELDSVMEDLEDSVDQRENVLGQLKEIYRKIFEIRLEKIEILNTELRGDVKITLKEGGITTDYENSLKHSLRGKGFNYKESCEIIVKTIKPHELSLIILKEDATKLSTLAKISKDKAKQIIMSLLDSQDIFKIETVYCPDLPTFFLKVDSKNEIDKQEKENFRATENLSTGQRCTAILPIIFAASSNPLIIDQPEDHLDNKYIADSIHKIMKRKKDTRQMIFVTHNPNIPVLADAEFNLFLDYKGRKSRVDAQGTITEVKTNILTLLEGGAEAFKTRSEIYGY